MIDFLAKTWSVEISHHVPKSDGLWFRAVNAENEEEALIKATNLFEAEGLNSIFIDEYLITELIQPGGDSDGSGQIE